MDLLQQHLEQARADLVAVSGGTPLCRITSEGSIAVSVKYAEGSWAALDSVRQEMRRGVELAPATEVVLARWRSDLLRWSSQAGSSWVPYCEDGVDALLGLHAELR